MGNADIEIFGGGIFGLAVAFSCARRGVRVRVIEKRKLGAGASGGVVGALAPHTPDNWNPKKQFQLESLVLAEDWWSSVSRIGGLDVGYARMGRLQPIPTERALEIARIRQEDARKNWMLGNSEWVVENARKFGTWCPASPTGWIIRDTLSARLHPRRAIQGLASALRSLGCEFIQGSVEGRGSNTKVIATGLEGLVNLGKELGLAVGSGEKGQALVLEHEARAQPQIFGDGLHIIPQMDGTVAIGSTSERTFDHESSTDHKLEGLHARAIRLLPAIKHSPVISRWAGVRPRPITLAPILGPHPAQSGIFIANGGFKIGFGIAPGVGEAMADLILDGRNRIPDRFLPANLLPKR